MTEMHAVTRDRREWAKAKPKGLDYLRHAAKVSRRRPHELVREFARLHLGRGKLTLPEYVQYGVYDVGRLSPEDQERFVTNNLHWPITRSCSRVRCSRRA